MPPRSTACVRPRHRATSFRGLAVERRGAVLSGTLRHVGRQYEDDQNIRSLAPATTLDAYAAVPVVRGWLIEARAENLADARVEAAYSGRGC